MTYRTFATKNADYTLQLSGHYRTHPADMLDGIDALVIETGEVDFASLLYSNDLQMALPLRLAKSRNIPVYSTDTPVTQWGEVRDAYCFIGLRDALMAMYGRSAEPMNDADARAFSTRSFIAQSPIVAGRDAINARKIEEFVVPRTITLTEKERPRIGLVYGYHHVGLEYQLKQEWRRDITLWNWRNLNFGRWAGFCKEQLGTVRLGVWDRGMWHVNQYETTLFR